MNGFQSPQLLSDLYRDLRDRRLLPLVVVLAVALVVVPIALSSSPKAAGPAPLPAGAPVASKGNVPSTQVVAANPGVRDFHRRLKGDAPKDPFVQEFPPLVAPAAVGPTSSASAASASTSSAGTPSPVSAASSPTVSGGSPTTSAQAPSGSSTKIVFYRLKVRAGPVGGEMKTLDEVGPSTSLPSASVPALAFLGVTFDSQLNAKRAFFLVHNGVPEVSGDGQCTFGAPCQLYALKPGQHVDVVWLDGAPYRVTLLDFERHTRANPDNSGAIGTAPTGRLQKGHRESSGRKAAGRNVAGQYFSF